MIKGKPGRNRRRSMISSLRFPAPTAGYLDKYMLIPETKMKCTLLGSQRRSAGMEARPGNHGCQRIQQGIGHMATIMLCGLMKLILIVLSWVMTGELPCRIMVG